MFVKTHKKVTIRAKVFRAKTGKWEDLGIVWQNQGRIGKIIKKVKQWLQY